MTFPLTSHVCFGNAGLPQIVEGRASTFAMPHMAKRMVHKVFCQQSRQRCILWTVLHIGGTRPDVRETQAAFYEPGSVFRLFLCLNPKIVEVPMLRFLLSSRFTRLRHHVLSLLTTLAVKAAATAVLGAVLALPVLYFVEVL